MILLSQQQAPQSNQTTKGDTVGNAALVVWLLLFGIVGLVSTELPKWIVPLGAIIAAVFIGIGSFRGSGKP